MTYTPKNSMDIGYKYLHRVNIGQILHETSDINVHE